MRDPYEVLGVSEGGEPGRHQERLRKLAKKLHPDANKNDPKAAAQVRRAERAPTRSSATTTSARRSTAARSTPRASRASRASKASAAARRGGRRIRPRRRFRELHLGAGGLPARAAVARRRRWRRRRLRGHPERHVRRRARGGAAAARGFEFEPRTSARRPRPGRHRRPPTITLNEAAHGGTRRVDLPTGKEIEVKIPAGLADGQQIRLKGQGMPGPAAAPGDVLITVSIAPHPLFERDGQDLRLELAGHAL